MIQTFQYMDLWAIKSFSDSVYRKYSSLSAAKAFVQFKDILQQKMCCFLTLLPTLLFFGCFPLNTCFVLPYNDNSYSIEKNVTFYLGDFKQWIYWTHLVTLIKWTKPKIIVWMQVLRHILRKIFYLTALFSLLMAICTHYIHVNIFSPKPRVLQLLLPTLPFVQNLCS